MVRKNKSKKKVVVTEVVVPSAPVPNEKKRERNRIRRARRKAALVEGGFASGEMYQLGPNQTRSGVVNNPADPRSIHPLSALGNTPNGRRAAVKMLHPCGEHDTFVTKVPDGAATASVVLERRDEYNLSNQGATENWECIIVHLPFLVQTRVAIQWVASTSPTQDQLQSVLNTALGTHAAGSEPIYPAWASQTISGIVFHVSILQSSTVTPTVTASGPDSLFRDIRRCAYGSTVDFTANSLTDAGRVLVGQWSADVTLATEMVEGTFATTPAVTAVTDEFDIYRGILPPLTSSEMVSNDLKIYQNKAKCGSYMPLRNWESEYEFSSAHELRFIDLSNGGTGAAGIHNNQPTQDIWFRGWGIGVELYESMDTTTTLRLKLREDLELVTTTTSPYAPFSTDGFSEDLRALSIVKEFSRMEPHAYPSDFNSLNEMLKNIIGGVGTAVSNLGIPVVSGLAPMLANLVKGLF